MNNEYPAFRHVKILAQTNSISTWSSGISVGLSKTKLRRKTI